MEAVKGKRHETKGRRSSGRWCLSAASRKWQKVASAARVVVEVVVEVAEVEVEVDSAVEVPNQSTDNLIGSASASWTASSWPFQQQPKGQRPTARECVWRFFDHCSSTAVFVI